MAFPAGASTITVIGTLPSPVGGVGRQGRIVFTPSTVLVDSTNHAIYSGGGEVVVGSGVFSVILLCTDDPDVKPTGWRWRVDEQPAGGQRRIYWIDLPSTLGPTVHLDVVAPVADPGGEPTGSAGGALTGSYPNPQLSAATISSFDPAGAAAAAQSAASADATGKVAAHAAVTTSVHGIASTAALETQAGAQSKADAAQTAATTAAASALAAHEADTTAVHGIADTSALETSTGSQAKVTAHAGAADPHGDRSWATSSFYPAASGSALDGYVNDALTRLAAIEGGTAFLAGMNTTGPARVVNTDLRVEGTSGTIRHHFDGAANTVGLYGATPVARQTVSGSRADGTAAASLLSALATLGLVTDSSTAGPAGPGWADRPSDQNLLAWTYDPNMAGHVTAQSNAGVAGRVTLVRIILRETITWSNVWIGLSGVDAGASLSNCYLGVYDSAGTLKGATADISSSLMSGATAKALPLVTPFSAASGLYYVAMLLNGTWTTNSLTFKASGAGVSVNAGLTAPNLRYSNLLTAQTSLPSSLTLSSQATSIINTGWGSQWYGVS